MIVFEHEGNSYNFRNGEDEVTLRELAKISDIMTTTDAHFEKWLKVVELLGDKGLAEVIDEDGLLKIIEHTDITNIQNEVQEVINVKGREYATNVNDGKIKLSGKDLAMIERYAKKGGDWAAYAFAVCYKDTELTNTEHYTDAHIKHKANIFGDNLKAKDAAPVFYQLQKKLTEHIERVSNAYTKSV